MGKWQDGEVLGFDNDDLVVYVKTHPRLQRIDIYVRNISKTRSRLLAYYSDDVSEWDVMRWLKEDYPELNLKIDEDEYDDD